MKIKLAFLLLFVTTISFAQIKVRTVSDNWEEVGSVGALGIKNVWCEKNGDTYMFTFKDLKYKQLEQTQSFSFKDEDGAFDSIYDMIMRGLDEKPEDNIVIDLPEGELWLYFDKTVGVISFRFAYFPNGISDPSLSQYLNKKQVTKLFGKKEKKDKKKKKKD